MRNILLFFGIFMAFTAGARDGFEARLAAVSARTQSIECDFTLTKTMGIMAGEVVSSGRFYYLRDAGISLDFAQPAGDLVTLGREKFRIRSAGRTTTVRVDSNPALRQLQRMLTACMTGDAKALGQCVCQEGEHDYTVTLSPGRGAVRRIAMTFEKDSMTLSRLRMEEQGGDVSDYVFSNKKINGGVDPGRFAI